MYERARTIKMDDAMRAAAIAQREAFIAKFGRDPGPDDPVFFDPDEDEPVALTEARMDKLTGTTAVERDRIADERTAEMVREGRVIQHERNAPCLCGSGKKWKKCHGA